MENKLRKIINFLSISAFFLLTNCQNEEIGITTQSKNANYSEKVKLEELISEIGNKDIELISLIKSNPVSKMKNAIFQKNDLGNVEFYFDTSNIMAIKNGINVVYIIPVYKSALTKDSNLYNLSVNILEKKIDAKFNIIEINDDGSEKYISEQFNINLNKLTSKTHNIECICTVVAVSGCTCSNSFSFFISCSSCTGSGAGLNSGGSSTGGSSGSGTSGSANSSNTIGAVWANSSSYGYVYTSSPQSLFLEISKLYRPDLFTSLQKFNFINNPLIAPVLVEFLKGEGVTPENKKFILSILDAIENGVITNDLQVRTLMFNFKYRVILDPTLKNNPCLFGVYTKLGEASTFQKYLQKFDGDFSVANLKLSVGLDPNHAEASATTYEPINFIIEIKFNPNKLNSPPLNIARTFIHEMLHAEMYRKLLSIAGQPNIPWSADFIKSIKDDYLGIADYYTRFAYNVPTGQSPSSAQHELMAQHSRDIIIQVLKQYDPTQTNELYNALAWIGLMGNGIIDNTTGLPPQPTIAWANIPQAERLHILDLFYNFRDTNPKCQ